jgi:hypothetical protein
MGRHTMSLKRAQAALDYEPDDSPEMYLSAEDVANLHEVYSCLKEALEVVDAQQAVIDRAEDILRKAQAPRRPDGTYNHSREAFEQMANDYFAAAASTGKVE